MAKAKQIEGDKRMKLQYCPKSHKQEWANYAPKYDKYRCCRCGQTH